MVLFIKIMYFKISNGLKIQVQRLNSTITLPLEFGEYLRKLPVKYLRELIWISV